MIGVYACVQEERKNECIYRQQSEALRFVELCYKGAATAADDAHLRRLRPARRLVRARLDGVRVGD